MKKHVETATGRLMVTDEGAGDPIVFIHGGLVTSAIWDRQIAHFSRGFRAITYDQRGNGESDLPTAPFSHTADLKALLDALGIERATIVGCSAGGGIAIDFALEYPASVERLVLLTPSIGGFRYPFVMTLRTIAHAINYGRFGLEKATERFIENPYWSFFVPQTGEGRNEFRKAFLANARMYQGKQGLSCAAKPAAIGRLGEIRAPTLLIVCDRDSDFNLRAGIIASEKIPGVTVKMIPGCGHLPNVEAPDETNRLIGKFIGA